VPESVVKEGLIKDNFARGTRGTRFFII